MFTQVPRVLCGVMTMAAVTFLTSSCGGPASGAADSGTISVTVGALPVIDDVGVYIAADRGIFKRFGLNVTIKPVLSSTVAIPMMRQGAVNIVGGGNYVSFIKLAAATPANPPFRILAEAATCSPGSFQVLALPSSGIQTPADLKHKTIAVNLTGNIQTLMINSSLQADNVDPSTVRFVVVPFPKMVAALEAHQVDAISVVEPFSTTAQQAAGAQPILDQCSGPDGELPLSGYIASSGWAQQNPEAVRRFRQAIAQAQELADTDRGLVEQTLLQYVRGLSRVQAATITLEQFPISLDNVQLNRVSALMQEAGLISKTLQASALILK